MNLRRIVTDKHSIDIRQLEDQEAVTITDLETENKITMEVEAFFDLVELFYRLSPHRNYS